MMRANEVIDAVQDMRRTQIAYLRCEMGDEKQSLLKRARLLEADVDKKVLYWKRQEEIQAQQTEFHLEVVDEILGRSGF
jgi:hypothetical protein